MVMVMVMLVVALSLAILLAVMLILVIHPLHSFAVLGPTLAQRAKHLL